MTTPEEIERIGQIREMSRVLVTLGACATSGGIQALRNFADVAEFRSVVYAHPEYLSTLSRSTPISAHVSRGLRAARLPDRQGPAARGARRAGRAPQPADPHLQRVCGVQAARQRRASTVAHGTPVPGAGDPGRLRGAVPRFRARVLRLLRAAEHPEHRLAHGPAGPRGDGPRRPRCGCTGRSTPRRSRSGARASARSARSPPAQEGHDEPHRHRRTAGGPAPTQTLQVGMLARVEGEGGLHLEIADGVVTSVELRIFEPPRFYEAFLRGRAYTEPPDITARICGICPVAYQFSSCLAIEDACGVTVPDHVRADAPAARTAASGSRATRCTCTCCTRRTSSGTRARSRWPPTTRTSSRRGLRLKKAGNDLMDLVGGRSVHPVNVRLGGFYHLPDPRRAARVPADRSSGRSTTPWRPCAWSPPSTSPTWSSLHRTCRCARRPATRSRAATW